MNRAFLVPFLLCLAAPAARADSIAVLGLEAIEAPEGDVARLSDALRRRLAQVPAHIVVPGKDLVEMKLVFGCTDDDPTQQCIAQAGRSLVADKLVYGTVRGNAKRPGGTSTLTIRFLDVKTAAVEKYLPSEVLTPDDFSTAGVASTAARILEKLMGLVTRTSLTVSSVPPESNVAVDDRPRGQTPVTIADIQPGVHVVSVARPGFKSRNAMVRVRPGDAAKVEVVLEVVPPKPVEPGPTEPAPPVEPVPPEPEKQSSPSAPGRTAKILGAVALVLAVGAAGGAIGTWKHYGGLETEANDKLKTFATETEGGRAYAAGHSSWFAKPNCSFPGGTPAGGQSYVDTCNEGTSYANATTGLLVGAGVLGAAGIAALVVGLRAQPAESPREEPAKTALRPRLQAVAPAVTATGGGISAAFEF